MVNRRRIPTSARRVAVGVSAAAVGATLLAGAAAPTVSAATSPLPTASRCSAASPLGKSFIKTNRTVSPGTTLTVWRDPVGRRRQLQVTVLKGRLDTARLAVAQRGAPGSTDPKTLAGAAGTIGMINGDFFDLFETGDDSPRSAVVTGGQLTYAPPGWSTVVGQAERVQLPSEIQRVAGAVTLGMARIPVSSMNGRAIPARAAAVYDGRWTGGSVVPKGAVTIVVRGGAVARVYRSGSTVAPRNGSFVVQVPASLAALTTKIASRAVATLSVRATDGTTAVKRTLRSLSAARVQPVGGLKVGRTTIPLESLDYHRKPTAGIAVYDAGWTGGRTPQGAVTVILRNGVVSDIKPAGKASKVDAGKTVVQVSSGYARTVRAWRIGTPATLTVGYRTDTGATFTEALGRGGVILRNSAVTAACDWAADAIRPRTVMGWDKAGNVYFATATSGRPDSAWSILRTGGATLHEMAVWLKARGATDAVAFDGGGSTIMMLPGASGPTRVDLPATAWRRPVPNAILLQAAPQG